MIYADTDFFVALVKEDDWLQENSSKILKEYQGDIRTGLTTFIELFFLSQDYGWDRERVASNVFAIAEVEFDQEIVFQASEYMENGLGVIDSFQLSQSDGRIISSDKEFDQTGIERINLESI